MLRRLTAAAAVLLCLTAFAACGDDDGGDIDAGSSTTTTAASGATTTTGGAGATTTTGGTTSDVLVYFVRDEKIAAASRTVTGEGVGRAAVEAMIDGPSADEGAAGLSSEMPDGTGVLGLDIAGGLATIDLTGDFEDGGGSLSMQLRVAQVVYTLTQFPTVSEVAFYIDGEPVEAIGGEGIVVDPPVDRDDFEGVTPAILLETPTVGADVSSPLTISGTANTFEATFLVRVENADGNVLVERVVTATSGSGTRGTFEASVTFEVDADQDGIVVVFEASAQDGSPVNVVEVPVNLRAQ